MIKKCCKIMINMVSKVIWQQLFKVMSHPKEINL